MKALALVLLAVCFNTDNAHGSSAFGLASEGQMLRSTETALTGIFLLRSGDMIQGFLMMGTAESTVATATGSTTEASTNVAFGAVYKSTVSGDVTEGFHLGGGIGIGTYSKSKSFFSLKGLGGFHFSLSKKVLAHIDGGLAFSSIDSKSYISLSGSSPLFGLSLVYNFN